MGDTRLSCNGLRGKGELTSKKITREEELLQRQTTTNNNNHEHKGRRRISERGRTRTRTVAGRRNTVGRERGRRSAIGRGRRMIHAVPTKTIVVFILVG